MKRKQLPLDFDAAVQTACLKGIHPLEDLTLSQHEFKDRIRRIWQTVDAWLVGDISCEEFSRCDLGVYERVAVARDGRCSGDLLAEQLDREYEIAAGFAIAAIEAADLMHERGVAEDAGVFARAYFLALAIQQLNYDLEYYLIASPLLAFEA